MHLYYMHLYYMHLYYCSSITYPDINLLCLLCECFCTFYAICWSMGKRNFDPVCNYVLHGTIDNKVNFELIIGKLIASIIIDL